MADRDASFFGPVLPQPLLAPEAFSFDELQRVRANRIEADLLRAGPTAGWPEQRRFRTVYPPAAALTGERLVDAMRACVPCSPPRSR